MMVLKAMKGRNSWAVGPGVEQRFINLIVTGCLTHSLQARKKRLARASAKKTATPISDG
jgi:hypothetical protein